MQTGLPLRKQRKIRMYSPRLLDYSPARRGDFAEGPAFLKAVAFGRVVGVASAGKFSRAEIGSAVDGHLPQGMLIYLAQSRFVENDRVREG
jgi:hypothetical protein